MPPAKRRKISPPSEAEDATDQMDSAEPSNQTELQASGLQVESSEGEKAAAGTATEVSTTDKTKERQERFKALQARAVSVLGSIYLGSYQRSDALLSKIQRNETSKKRLLNLNGLRLTLTFSLRFLANKLSLRTIS